MISIFLEAKMNGDGWVDGMKFLRLFSPITQYHARMWELEREGHNFEWDWVYINGEKKNWKRYRLIGEPINEVPPAFDPKPEPLNTKQAEFNL